MTKRSIMNLVLLTAGLIPISASGQGQRHYPPLESAWKLEEGIPQSNIDFDVKNKGVYIFAILFRSDTSSDDEIIRIFLGDGSYKFTVDKSISAKKLMPGVDGNITELERRANRGEIVRQPANPGTVISLEFSIERLDVEGVVVEPRIVETKGIDGYLPGIKFRVIAEKTLEPGRYRARSSAKLIPTFPKGLVTSLAVLPPRQY